MSRATLLTENDVFPVIQALLAAGEYPTAAALRTGLGGRGSPVVLQRFLASWYEAHGPALAEKAQAQRIPATAGGLRAQLSAATQEALREFDAQQAARVRALDERAAVLDAREATVQAHESRLDEREMGFRELVEQLRSEAGAATKARDACLVEKERLASELAAAAERERAAAVLVEKGRKDAEALATLRAELATARGATSAAESLALERQRQRDELRDGLNRAEAAQRKLQGDFDTVQQERDTARVDLARARERADAEARSRVAAEAQRDAAQERHDRVAAQLVAVEGERAGWQGRHDAVAGERDRLQDTLLARLDQVVAAAAPRARKSAKPRPRG